MVMDGTILFMGDITALRTGDNQWQCCHHPISAVVTAQWCRIAVHPVETAGAWVVETLLLHVACSSVLHPPYQHACGVVAEVSVTWHFSRPLRCYIVHTCIA